ncbi:putative DsbA family dithiol-disulfide isomerase [Chryseobacterium defluvii]|uniref:Putative DsbA family dithiol-disulfide isomerase n=1 Tax=Chryseobacterium defluvii TaxID=160396 RepID=A0A840KD85_9FLAO|nr:DsbA family oxidoreductase [Chryseobacterium defluvii]MBB4805503.1 putative DsbA family dithiol-disulfide isomerase [Chryseobacterium defluvii]
MKIEIWSDVMCPFCYIGKHNFEKALQNLSFEDKVDVEWKSFQLDPSLKPSEIQDTLSYFKDKKGFPENRSVQMINHVTQLGKQAGIDFDFENALITNTFSAHQLLHLSKIYHLSSETEEALFKAHFVDGENIADIGFLISLAEKLGIDGEEAKQVLTSDRFHEEVKQDISEATNNEITGVPFFVLDGKYAVSGAQPVEVFENALQQAYKETVTMKDLSDDDSNSCDTDECKI